MNELARRAVVSRQLVLKPLLADLAFAAKDDPHAPCYSWAEAWDEIGAENTTDDEDETDDDDSSIGEAAAGGDDDSMSDSSSSIGEAFVGGELGSGLSSDSESESS